LLAGCWEKIEYAGRTSSPTHPPDAQTARTELPADIPPDSSPTASTERGFDSHASPHRDSHSSAAVQPHAPARHTDARTASATVEVAAEKPFANTKRAAWQLGSCLSRAALAHDRGFAADRVPAWFDQARAAATTLATSVADLPETLPPDDQHPLSPQVLDYLGRQYQRIVGDLTRQYGPQHAALFEIALKSNMLVLLYSPGSSTVNTVSAAISHAAPQAQLPDELWKPLVALLEKPSAIADVRAAIRKMHIDVDQYLATAAEPTGR
jgi:hypothetical protein